MSPSLEDIRNIVPLHSSLVHIGHGILINREGKYEDDSRRVKAQMMKVVH